MSKYHVHPMPSDESVNGRVAGVRRSFGPYRLERILSEGATGIVIEAQHRLLDRRVKTFNPRGFERSGLTVSGLSELFLHEARVLASIDHPHVVPILDAGWARGGELEIEIPYLALKLMRGDLLDHATRHGPLSSAAALRLARDRAAGLLATHEAGWLHRDLKPANVLLDATGAANLSDYSAALACESTGIAIPRLIGTAGYLAPELLAGGPPDRCSDVYALGATLFFALHAVAPHAWPPGALERWVRQGRRADGRLDRTFPGLRAIVGLALQADPGERYPSAAELLLDCRRLLLGEAPQHAQQRRPGRLFAST